jgi:hypothetical protein
MKISLNAQIEELQRAIDAYPQLEARGHRKGVVDYRIHVLQAAKHTLECVLAQERGR